MGGSPIRILRGALLVLVAALSGATLAWVRADALELFRTPTPSMVPSLMPGDVFVADVRPNAGSAPRPGQVVLFEVTPGARPLYAKRVVATAGSWVALSSGRLVVDGIERTTRDRSGARHVEQLGPYRYVVESSPGSLPLDFEATRVPPDHVFVLGDSRGRSVDSRSFGPVPVAAIRGRALRVLWSRDRQRHWRWERVLTPLDGASVLAAAPGPRP